MSNPDKKPKLFGIWGNTDKPRFWELLNPILDWSIEKGLTSFITTRIQDQLPSNFNNKFSHYYSYILWLLGLGFASS